MSKVYMVEVGVSLRELDKTYECKVNGETHYLYDENVVAFFNKDQALEFLHDYIEKGVDRTYGVLWDIERKLEDYEIKEINDIGYLEDEYLPRNIENVYFKVKGGE